MAKARRSSLATCSEMGLQVGCSASPPLPSHLCIAWLLPSWGWSPPRGPRGQHLYFLDGAHIQACDIELLHGAAAEAPLPSGVVQPDAVTALVILPSE